MNEGKPSAFADLLAGVAWLLIASGIVIGAWQMDRMTHLQASLYTAPGLVPGLLGSAILLMAAMLIVRALRAGALARRERVPFRLAEHWRLIVGLVLTLGFAIGLVGHGLPFWVAGMMFATLFILIYQYEERKAAGTLPRGIVVAVVVGVVSSLAVHYMFQDLFLVRLP